MITSPELDHARVYVTALGDDNEREEIVSGLRSAAAFIRKQLGGRLHMRRIPELHFEEDRVLKEALRIEELLRQALPNDAQEADAEEGEASDGGAEDAEGQEKE